MCELQIQAFFHWLNATFSIVLCLLIWV